MSVFQRDVVALHCGKARCDVVPQAGGSIAGYWWEEGEARVDWLRPASAADVARADPEAMGCFPLVPWGNRIRDGRFKFCGREVVDRRQATHALHGHGWRAPWEVVERAADRVVLEYAHEAGDWPWSYRARETVVLAEDGLTLTLELANRSDSLMPAGLGFHPYFPRDRDTVVEAAPRAVWMTDADILPRDAVPVPADWDMSAGLALAGVAVDNVFTGWDGNAAIAWPGRGRGLAIAAEWPVLSFLALYAPPARDFFCVEPMSHCPDAINLARAGAAETGVRVLAPGAARSATIRLSPHARPH